MAHAALRAWDRITSLAVLGLGRHAPVLEELLPDAAVKLPEGSVEQGVLRCAAATLLVRLAGQRSAVAAMKLPIRAGSTAERSIVEPALRRLALLSAARSEDLISEWFSYALKSGKVLPPQWVPPIFEALSTDLRREYAPVFGARLRWLASLDARWVVDGADQECNESDWMTGSAAERIALLRRARAADPGKGRAWLEATWSTDAPEARTAFVQALKCGLSSADEPFLERALDDKRRSVRLAAMENLARLPNSALVERSLTRLQPVFVFEPQGSGLLARLSSRTLRIELPQALDKAAQRDGIELKPPAHLKIGERSFWFMQLLSIPPPSQWLRRFDCTAVELLAAAARTDHAQEIFTALCTACVRHPDSAWVAALGKAWRARAGEHATSVATGITALLAALPAEARDQHLQIQLSELFSEGSIDVGMHLLACSDHAWSSATTALAFDLLLAHIRSSSGSHYASSRSFLESWGRRVEVASAAPAAKQVLDAIGLESPARNAVERVLEVIEFRIAMRQELLA